MSEKQMQLYNTISELPDNLFDKVMDYIEYLRFSTLEDVGAPDELKIKSKEDLLVKLEDGIKDSNDGKLVDFDDVFSNIGKILTE